MKKLKLILKYSFGLFFVFAGINHFRTPDSYVTMMPNYLPLHLELVYLSGIGEVTWGFLILVPKYTRIAAWSLIILLIVIFPANIHMALNPAEFPGIPPVALWLRLPLQGVLIFWAYWFTKQN